MDFTVISTYRCNSRCSTCNIWMHSTRPVGEIPLEVLGKIPGGIDNLNITGGEPTLREDLMDIVDLLYPKAMQLEISSNGLYPERIEPIIKKYPNVKIRFSLAEFEATNSQILGEETGCGVTRNVLPNFIDAGILGRVIQAEGDVLSTVL